MGSDAVRQTFRAVTLAVTGGILALAATQGLYATALLATMVALWMVVRTVVEQRPAPPLPAAPALPNSDADALQRLTAYLELSPAPLVSLDGDRLRAVNRAARRLLGASDLVPDPPAALCTALTDTRPGRTAQIELNDAGAIRSFALTTSDLTLPGRMLRIGALIDIDTALKAAEAAALRELIQVLSHEIVNALTPIASLAATAVVMLDDPVPPLPQVREAIETVARRAASLHRFGESYRALARLPQAVPRRVAVAGFASDLAMLFAARWPAIGLVLETLAAPSNVAIDPDQINAALWAVLQNAAEALAGTPAAEIRLSFEAQIGRTLIAIVDNGPGIAAQDESDIFRPFFTTKPEGSGIGLSLARQILRGHGGDLILVSSHVGRTAFEATIPS
ncbi:HAMP domain-containing sensor histidine kinase [Sphingomonas sp. CARO-RG-8B-R24-01]|uniref:sensor histidine kinase n=1 Tax=Sphingomonas sp. CARO-RG-8B-R24-01 TaxID=2914831 RepID=UPI001F55F60B|nr:HAMP domain-containing sensor histidine kinase [Sphingomonas sp. CARO-RG-8B-R24-01]